MKKATRQEVIDRFRSESDVSHDSTIENFKRRRALPPCSSLDLGSKHFFDRILQVPKGRELVFFTKAMARSR